MNHLSDWIVKFKNYWKHNETSAYHPEAKDDQMHVMSDDEKLDQAIEESFPASDPPGHISKSEEDLRQY